MKKANKMFKYSAETNEGVIARANAIEEIENRARKQMFLFKLKEATIFENNAVVKIIKL